MSDLDYMDCWHIANAAYDEWAAKPHNKKRAEHLERTPIKNDLLVAIANHFTIGVIKAETCET